ncbi:ArnT family glycosyltransferase [Nocardia stercoris]|uniref:Phospholipid carrier-dependent glycosyltransferase n=1 Tax=Nocardia stercoris TaxID=2483361 RepID=A0A3M2L2X6_9NOCA|nr:glycosyltransferase family 39 protein [Nocardia stercoris]RMI31901.1 phospholipid carrier-dependent glycosyltransferase [Nocardia stercoris]
MTTASVETPHRVSDVEHGESAQRPLWHRLLLGTPAEPRWARPGLIGLLLVTAALYLWDLTASGYANDFYAAAAQAGTQDWKALLFGSLDAGNSITVDKPPAAMWVMGLSGRLLSFSSFSLLLPQALMGVGSVALVHAAVRRWSGPAAGLLAGAVLAVTPVAALMFRFDNPDALLVLLLVAAAYCTARATEIGSGWWLAGAGVALGFGFLTKMMQALLVLPALGLVFLIAAPIGIGARLVASVGAVAALVVSGGWFVALVALWPAASRPYIGGSTDNSLLELALGYNGLGRVLGNSGNHGGGPGGPGGPGGIPGFGGTTGITRMFGTAMGTEISWLLPAALIGLVAGLWLTRRAPRTDRTRAGLVLWGGWLLVAAVVFSYMQGTMHPYYTTALAPAIAAVVGISLRELWIRRVHLAARATLAVLSAGTGVWGFALLDRAPHWYPALRWIVLIGAVAAAAALLLRAANPGRLTAVIATAAVVFSLLGTTAYTLATVATPHTGGIPVSGPNGDGMRWTGHPGSGRPFGLPGAPGVTIPPNGAGMMPPDGMTPPNGLPAPNGSDPGSTDHQPSEPNSLGDGHDGFGGPGVAGNTALQALLRTAGTHWAAASIGSMAAVPLELSTGTSIMAIGGFTGGDASPTLDQFEQYVAGGRIHYFIPGGMGGPGGGGGNGSSITDWVRTHYTAITVGGNTIYDLTRPVQ